MSYYKWVESLTWSSCPFLRPLGLVSVEEILVGYTQLCLRVVSWWSVDIPIVVWGLRGYILPGWPYPWVQMFCLRLWNPDPFTEHATLSRTCCFQLSLSLYRTCCLDLWILDYKKLIDIYTWGTDLLHPLQPLWLLFDPAGHLWTFEHLEEQS